MRCATSIKNSAPAGTVRRGRVVRAELVHLEALAAELTALGLVCEMRDELRHTLLRVWHPAVPIAGESVQAIPIYGQTETWWFSDSSGQLMTRCTDLQGSARAVVVRLARFIPQLAPLAQELRRCTPVDSGRRDRTWCSRYRPTW